MAARSTVAVGALALAGCFPSFDGFVGPAEGGADGGEPVALSDGGGCPDAAPAGTVCLDFDQGALESLVDRRVVRTGGTAELRMDTFRSAPRSLYVSTGALDGGAETEVLIEKGLATSMPARVTCSYDLYLDELPAAWGSLSSIGFAGSPSNYYVGLSLSGGSPIALEQAPAPANRTWEHPTSRSLAARRWTRVTVDVDIGGRRLDLLFDGESVVTDHALNIPFTSTSNVRFLMGVQYAKDAAWSAHYDNLLCAVR